MSRASVFRMGLEQHLSRRRRLQELRWRELCQRRGREAAQEGGAALKPRDGLRPIRDVAHELHIKEYVLRFWETRFPELCPVKRGYAGRFYRPVDVELASTIRDLLLKDGYTLKGARKVLQERGVRARRSDRHSGH